MTILVTGGAGYIGSHVAHALVDAGEQVVVVDDLSTGIAHPIPANTPLVVGNCGDAELVDEVLSRHNVTTVMHFAGSILVSESFENPLRYHQNNVVNTRALIESAIRHDVTQFIFASTAAIYGQLSQMPVTEDAPTRPLSPYGQSKLVCEQMLHDATVSNGLKFVALRYFNVAGADPQMRTGQLAPAATHVIRRAIQTAIGLRPQMEVYGTDYATPDGTCLRDYIDISDAARAHLDALRYLRAGGPSVTLNCGSGRGSSVYEVVQSVKRVSGVDFRVSLGPRRAGDPASVIASPARARAVLGWKAQIADLDEIVRHAMAWEMKLKTPHDSSAGPVSGTGDGGSNHLRP